MQRGTVAAIQVDVIARRVGDVESHRMTDDKGHGLGFELARITRFRAIVRAVQQFVRVLVNQHAEFCRRRETVQDLNPPAGRRPVRVVQIIDVLDRDALRRDRGLESACLGPRIAGRLPSLRQRLAVRLFDVLSRDSATRSRQRRPGRRRHHLHDPNSRWP